MGRTKRLPLAELAPYLLEIPAGDPAWRFDPVAVFGNDRPVELEVGFGKGLFLLTASQERPDVNFLGVETERKLQLYVATRLAKRQRANVRVARADARLLLAGAIAADSLQAVHVYFPDPWWKKRHHKRRVFTPAFVGDCERVLRPGGCLHVVTDVADYFALIADLMASNSRLVPLPPPSPAEPRHDLDYLTNFERKFRQEGRPIHRACYQKPPAG